MKKGLFLVAILAGCGGGNDSYKYQVLNCSNSQTEETTEISVADEVADLVDQMEEQPVIEPVDTEGDIGGAPVALRLTKDASGEVNCQIRDEEIVKED